MSEDQSKQEQSTGQLITAALIHLLGQGFIVFGAERLVPGSWTLALGLLIYINGYLHWWARKKS